MVVFEERICLSGSACPDDKVGEVCVRIRELPMADGVHASTGCQLWSAGVMLAHELLQRQSLILDKHVLEIGAGCGLVGIVTAALARSVRITDGDAEVVQNLEHNVRINESLWKARRSDGGPQISMLQLNWKDHLQKALPEAEQPEVILASDVIYGHWGDTMAQAMLNMLGPNGMILMCASEDRRGGVKAFKEILGQEGFRVSETKVIAPLGKFRLYECRRRQADEAPEHPEVIERVSDHPSASAVQQSESDQLAVAPAADHTPHASHRAAVSQSPTPSNLSAAPPAAAATAIVGKPLRPTSAVWKVVGGKLRKGIIVRNGVEGTLSEYVGRLAHGSLIKELESSDDKKRIHYQIIKGAGPGQGWVCVVSGKGAKLLSPAPAPLE